MVMVLLRNFRGTGGISTENGDTDRSELPIAEDSVRSTAAPIRPPRLMNIRWIGFLLIFTALTGEVFTKREAIIADVGMPVTFSKPKIVVYGDFLTAIEADIWKICFRVVEDCPRKLKNLFMRTRTFKLAILS